MRFGLGPEACRRYAEQGYLGPFELCTATAMARLRPRLLAATAGRRVRTNAGYPLPDDGPFALPPETVGNQHLVDDAICGLIMRPELLDPIASLLGPNLLLWRSIFWVKEPGTSVIPWHQDRIEWGEDGNITRNVSAWIALDDTSRASGCVELVAGSQRAVHPRSGLQDPEFWSRFCSAPTLLPLPGTEDRVVPMELRAGQFFLFDELTLHGSAPNRSPWRRCGLALRIVPPEARLRDPTPRMVLRGRDTSGQHRVLLPPVGLRGVLRRLRNSLRRLRRRALGGRA